MATYVPILRIFDCLIVSFVRDLSDGEVEELHYDVLEKLASSGTIGLLLDVTGFDLIDSYMARVLDDLGVAAKAMGCVTVLAGLKPSIAMTLVEMGIEFEHLHPVLNVDKGMNWLLNERPGARQHSAISAEYSRNSETKNAAIRQIESHLQTNKTRILKNYQDSNR